MNSEEKKPIYKKWWFWVIIVIVILIIISSTYENLGYEDSSGIMDGLYFDLEPSGNATIIDENSEIASSYPGDITTYPQETPVGAKCVNAQTCVGLNNVSSTIKMTVSKYDGNGTKREVTFTLNVD